MVNWKEYNNRQVKRYEFYISKEMVDEWKNEPINMNKGKRGRPFLYANTFVSMLIRIKIILRLTYRATEGFARTLAKMLQIEGFIDSIPDYSNLPETLQNISSRSSH